MLLINLGTPDDPSPAAIRRYLAEFLSDPYVIDIAAPLRFMLLHLVILPFRPRRVADAYRLIWTERGSPLRFHSVDLRDALRSRLDRPVSMGMRYGRPSLAAALDELQAEGVDTVRALPLFPQYSESAWETAAVATRELAAKRGMTVTFVPPFYDHPGFLDAAAAVARPVLAEFGADRVMMSFHGLPERHVRKTDRSATGHCLTEGCCDRIQDANRDCYRAQCYATARGLAERLGPSLPDWEVAFQSRLGRTPWIQPFTDHRLIELAESGCRRLAVLCPSFVADCLETLEEIQVRARDSFVEAGGEDLRLIPAVNSSAPWIDAAVDLLN